MTFGELPIGSPFKFRRNGQELAAVKVAKQYDKLRYGNYPPTFIFADTEIKLPQYKAR